MTSSIWWHSLLSKCNSPFSPQDFFIRITYDRFLWMHLTWIHGYLAIKCRHTLVGGSFVRGFSMGERKHTSIGFEILVDPSLLLLDEPTSVLDSTTATKLLQLLRSIAQVISAHFSQLQVAWSTCSINSYSSHRVTQSTQDKQRKQWCTLLP